MGPAAQPKSIQSSVEETTERDAPITPQDTEISQLENISTIAAWYRSFGYQPPEDTMTSRGCTSRRSSKVASQQGEALDPKNKKKSIGAGEKEFEDCLLARNVNISASRDQNRKSIDL